MILILDNLRKLQISLQEVKSDMIKNYYIDYHILAVRFTQLNFDYYVDYHILAVCFTQLNFEKEKNERERNMLNVI